MGLSSFLPTGRLAVRDGIPGIGAAVVLAAALLAPTGLLAQTGEGDCDVPDHDGFTQTTQSNGARIYFFSRPTIRCSGGTWINADSARIYEATNYSQLFGHVVFRDGETRLTADEARYFSRERRLRAWGTVVLTDLAEGSEFQGDTMVLLRAGPGRAEDQLTITGTRPHATLYPARQPPPPPPEAEVPPEAAAAEEEGAVEAAAPPPDRLAMVPDSGVAPLPDSALLLPDTTQVSPDSLALLPDSAAVPPDSLAIPADSAAVVPPDSLPENPDPAPAAPDSAGITPVEVVAVPPEPAPVPEEEVERTPYEIDAQRIHLEGSRYFRATGGVLINRDSLDAVADSVEYDGEAGTLFLARGARLRTATYDLSGEAVRLGIPQDEIRHIDARGHAVLEGEDLRLLAPHLSLFLEDGALERLVAMGDSAAEEVPLEEGEEEPPLDPFLETILVGLGLDVFPLRPFALAQDFQLEGDSIEVRAPGEVLSEVLAMGSARSISSSGDSLNTPDTPELLSRDWLEGDTIIATFGTPEGSGLSPREMDLEDPEAPVLDRVPSQGAPADSTGEKYQLESLVARVGAKSFYRMAASDSTMAQEDGRLAYHYVIGQEITILMSEGEIERMEVTGATSGIHAEPAAPRIRGGVVPDTTGIGAGVVVPPDTVGVGNVRGGRQPDTVGIGSRGRGRKP